MSQTPSPRDEELKEILEELSASNGEEYHLFHSGKQDFDLTNARMKYNEDIAIKKIKARDARLEQAILNQIPKRSKPDDDCNTWAEGVYQGHCEAIEHAQAAVKRVFKGEK